MSPLITLRSSIFTGVSSWIAQQVFICRHGCLSLGLALVILLTGAIAPPTALAVLRQVEEAPGQIVYQSRQSIRARDGHTWQVIAFQRLKPNGERSVYLTWQPFGVKPFHKLVRSSVKSSKILRLSMSTWRLWGGNTLPTC